MLVAAAVCPHPPLLVPEVAAGAAGELAGLRAACDAALASLLAARPGLLFLVGSAPERASFGVGDWGSLEGYGVDLRLPLGARVCRGRAGLPLSLTVGAWLVARSGWTGDVQAHGLPADVASAEAADAGAEIADLDDRVALLVLGDASACRSERAPGWLDARAAAYDGAVARALAGADPAALLALDRDLAADLLVAGRGPWQALAGAAAASGPAWTGTLLHDEAPYGVGYLVATWRPAG